VKHVFTNITLTVPTSLAIIRTIAIMKFSILHKAGGSSTCSCKALNKKDKKCKICLLRRLLCPWLEPSGRICVPPTPYRPDGMVGLSIDRAEWELVQRNFSGPVGHWYAPDDPDKPDVFMYSHTVNGENRGLAPIPLYQHRQDETNLPPYEWARLSSLPTPVAVGDSWSSLHAAQREKSRLLETQAYISSRMAEIDRKVKAVMDTKLERDPKLPHRYCGAQMTGALHAVGLRDDRTRVCTALEAGRLQNTEPYAWIFELDKLFVLRKRLSPLSLLSSPPAY
jgi:hypothetical protein